MISLCTDSNLIFSSVNQMDSSKYISEYIKLYLKSYGTEYNFQEFFLQKDLENQSITSVILRYNNQIYVSSTHKADLLELCTFLSGFTQCDILCDDSLKSHFPFSDTCYVMVKDGIEYEGEMVPVLLTNCEKDITSLIGKTMTRSERTDYFLNLSHQMRHNLVRSYGYFVNKMLVSAVVMSVISSSLHIVTTVFTDNNFRGNGYAKKILNYVCSNKCAKYLLLCEKHNVEFYKKCGFSESDICLRIRL